MQSLKPPRRRAISHEPGRRSGSIRNVLHFGARIQSKRSSGSFSRHLTQISSSIGGTREFNTAQGAMVIKGLSERRTLYELRHSTGKESLEDAFIAAVGSDEGLS